MVLIYAIIYFMYQMACGVGGVLVLLFLDKIP